MVVGLWVGGGGGGGWVVEAVELQGGEERGGGGDGVEAVEFAADVYYAEVGGVF